MEPDDTILFDTLREAGASPQLAHRAVQEVFKIAGHNITTTVESRIAESNSKIESLRREMQHFATKDYVQNTKIWWLVTAGAVGGLVGTQLPT
ncbi:MAG: hypothetical protein OXL36_16755 [Bryobacterales bacterium]|nr:hypothetical protein [Bryobacterales bacterium]MDE0296106.1 hypothetical protein [Bryobacterales bacterium]